MSILSIIVILVALERVVELAYATHNTRRLLALGAVESGRGHYPLIVALHAAWLVAIAFLIPEGRDPIWPLLGLFTALQGIRLWVIWSLGPRWTTRVITLKGAAPIRDGPYRYVKHPNYLVVVAEIALLPLVFGAWEIALAFSVLNAAVLVYRIRVENRALAGAA